MATGSADIAACAKVSDFGTLPLSPSPFISPCLSLSVSGLSIHIHLSDGSFWGAYSWHAGVFISTSNPFRVGLSDQSCHWQAAQASAPQQLSIHSSSWLCVVAEEEQGEAPVQTKNLDWLGFSYIPRHLIYLKLPKVWCRSKINKQEKLKEKSMLFTTVKKYLCLIQHALHLCQHILIECYFFLIQTVVQINVKMLCCRKLQNWLMSNSQNWTGAAL